MVSQNPQFLLKVLSGPHQGAEVLLGAGVYTIGSSEEADVILTDISFLPEHFKLIFNPPNVQLELLAGDVFLQGKRVKTSGVIVPFFQFLTIGSTHIVLGPAGEGWPLITALDAPPLQLNDDSDTEEIVKNESVDKETIQSIEPSSSILTDALAMGEGVNSSEGMDLLSPLNNRPQNLFLKQLPTILLFIVIIVLLTGLGVWYYNDMNSAALVPVKMMSLEERKNQLEDLLEVQGASKQVQITVVDGVIILSGYVQKESTRLSLRRSLSLVDVHALIKIQSEESLIQGAQVILDQFALPISIKIDTIPGFLILEGYAPMENIWKKVQALMIQDIEGLLGIKDQVISGEKFRFIANNLLQSKGLSGAITFEPKKDYILAEGSLTRSQAYEWDKILSILTQQLGGYVAIKDVVIKAEPQAIDNQYFDGEIESLTIGPFGFISLKNGQKYFVGAVLPSGYTIVALSHEGVTLRKGDESVIFKPQSP